MAIFKKMANLITIGLVTLSLQGCIVADKKRGNK